MLLYLIPSPELWAEELKATQQVSLNELQTVDLAMGEAKADPILVGEIKAPPDRYNALLWKMPLATSGGLAAAF
jgi:hypothetical protein